MSLFNLEGGTDIRCPNCFSFWDVNWDTEYGDPNFGQHTAECPKCKCKFEFGVYIEYTQENQQEWK